MDDLHQDLANAGVDGWEEQLRAELEEMRKGALLKRAVEVGVDEDSLEEAEEADDTKAALIELIVVLQQPPLPKAKPKGLKAPKAAPKAPGSFKRKLGEDDNKSAPPKKEAKKTVAKEKVSDESGEKEMVVGEIVSYEMAME